MIVRSGPPAPLGRWASYPCPRRYSETSVTRPTRSEAHGTSTERGTRLLSAEVLPKAPSAETRGEVWVLMSGDWDPGMLRENDRPSCRITAGQPHPGCVIGFGQDQHLSVEILATPGRRAQHKAAQSRARIANKTQDPELPQDVEPISHHAHTRASPKDFAQGSE